MRHSTVFAKSTKVYGFTLDFRVAIYTACQPHHLIAALESLRPHGLDDREVSLEAPLHCSFPFCNCNARSKCAHEEGLPPDHDMYFVS